MSRQQAIGNRQQATGVEVSPLPFSLFPFHCLLKSLCLLTFLLMLSPHPAAAQFGSSAGLDIQLIGIVQVEPGPNVLTLSVKDTEIRFQLQDISSTIRDFSSQQFLSTLRHRSPSLHIRGPESLLDLLLKERPSKRVLRLSGLYYSDSRRFLLSAINTVQEIRKPQF